MMLHALLVFSMFPFSCWTILSFESRVSIAVCVSASDTKANWLKHIYLKILEEMHAVKDLEEAWWQFETGDRSQGLQYETTMMLKNTTKQQEFKTVLLKSSGFLRCCWRSEKWQAVGESVISSCRQVLVPKSNTTRNRSQLRPLDPQEDGREKREEMVKSTSVVHKLKKPGPMNNLMLAR